MTTLNLDTMAINGYGDTITRPGTHDDLIPCTWGYVLVKALSGIYDSEQPLNEHIADLRYSLIKACKRGGSFSFTIEGLHEMKKCVCLFFKGPAERGAAKEFLEGTILAEDPC